MVNRKYLFFLLIGVICCLLIRCVGNGKKYFNNNEYCYSQKYKNYTQGKISTNGYYISIERNETPIIDYVFQTTNREMDTIFNSYYFFQEDGMFFSYNALKGNIIEFDDKFYEWNALRKGRYFIENDTIKLIDMDKTGQFKYILRRTYFKIIDSLKIKKIYFAWNDIIPTEKEIEKYDSIHQFDSTTVYNFFSTEKLPESLKVWFLKYGWCWCKYDEYKAFSSKK